VNLDETGGPSEPESAVAEGYASILEQVEVELADVEHALKRLDDGTYGVCEACGEPISASRLESSPAARLCAHDDNPVALRFF
jgi:RNA polymerase-binding transcription factor DksA